ncbi:uncharacterized protein [Typha latifolia]|uniref:uncharacterized protein isoform X1 n=1 Tax=Typha latifolia TaxID=4733 RepID=UPI003C30484C
MSSVAKKRAKKARSGESSTPLRIFREPSPSLFPSKEELLKLVAVLAIAASVAVACNYAAVFVSRHKPKPFCDSGQDSFDALNSGFCEPCPDNGRCYERKLECFHGYKKHGRICIEDGAVNKMARRLSDLLERIICDAYTRVLCDEAGKIWFQEVDITKILDEETAKEFGGLKDDGLKLAKFKARETADSFFETRAIADGSKEYKCPELVAELHKPLSCRIRQWIYRNILLVITVSGVFSGLLWFLWGIHQRQALADRAEILYQQVCEILEDNAINVKAGIHEGEPWVVASWLRDHLLSPRERKNVTLWKKVEELLQEDSRIDQYPKLIKGESKTVMHWQVDGSLSAKIKQMGIAKKPKLVNHADVASSCKMIAKLSDPQFS